MLSTEEKNKIKAILSEGLHVRSDVNLSYFLEAIDDTKDEVQRIISRINGIESKLDNLESRINYLISYISNLR